MARLTINHRNAGKIKEWIETRAGVAVWDGFNLSNLRQLLTPVLDETGHPSTKPAYDMPATPNMIITDAKDIDVSCDREVKRFHISIRMGAQGFMLKCTDASTRRIRAAVEKAGPGARYEFDYETQEAVIFAPEKIVPLTEYQS